MGFHTLSSSENRTVTLAKIVISLNVGHHTYMEIAGPLFDESHKDINHLSDMLITNKLNGESFQLANAHRLAR